MMKLVRRWGLLAKRGATSCWMGDGDVSFATGAARWVADAVACVRGASVSGSLEYMVIGGSADVWRLPPHHCENRLNRESVDERIHASNAWRVTWRWSIVCLLRLLRHEWTILLIHEVLMCVLGAFGRWVLNDGRLHWLYLSTTIVRSCGIDAWESFKEHTKNYGVSHRPPPPRMHCSTAASRQPIGPVPHGSPCQWAWHSSPCRQEWCNWTNLSCSEECQRNCGR